MTGNSRAFLFRLVTTTVAGCSLAGQRAPTPDAAEQRRPSASLELDAADAEVWAWDVPLTGHVLGGARLLECAVEVNGQATPAKVTDNRFSASVSLIPRHNTLFARCLTDRGTARSSVVRYTVRLVDRPKADAQGTIRGADLVLDGSASSPADHARAPLVGWQWSSRKAGLEGAPEAAVGTDATIAVRAPTADGEYRYRLRVTDRNGASGEASLLLRIAQGRATVSPAEGPSWIDDAVVYGIVPPLFGTPPLRAATDALDSIAALGATALWVSPVFESLPGDFGYAVTDYERVRSDYGTTEDLRAFLTAAHQRKLRVLFDLVPNHTSREHPYFRHAQKLGTRSHYFSFFDRDEAGQPVHYFDWEHLPNLGYDNAEVARWMTEVTVEWLRSFGVDGFRVDAAWGVARRSPAYWPAFGTELRRIDPELMLLAEASARDRYFLSHGFDAAYDWTDELGQWAWKDVFESPTGVARRLHEALARTAATAVRPERVFRFINNNDTGARFITRYGEDMTRVATAALLTLPGIPCLYMFDEVGAEFEPYAGLRPVRPLPRDEFRAFHAKLIRLRRSTAALRGPGFVPLAVDPKNEVYAYVRHGKRADDVALVVLNFGPQRAALRLQISERFTSASKAKWQDALTTRSFAPRAGYLDIAAEGWDTLILLPERDPGVRRSPTPPQE